VLRIFNVMTGCGLARADEFRRNLENPRLAPQVATFFKQKAKDKGYSQDTIDKVWATLEGFGSFGFCKAHGAAFAMPTYQSAWLKTHYPTEFMAGLFTHDPGMYPKRLLLAEARRLGVRLLPLDVNHSTDEYLVQPAPRVTTDPDEPAFGIRMALTEIQGVSEAEIKRVIEHQPYTDVADFYLRAKPSRRTLERLATVGALDQLANVDSHTRGDIVMRVRELNSVVKRPKLDPNQPMLDFTVTERMPTGNTEMSTEDRVVAELAILKMDISGHILDKYRPMLDAMGVTRSDELVHLRSKTEVLVAGVRVATQTPPMRSGKRVVFITLDDGHGCSDSTFFDEAQQRCASTLFNTKLLLISAKTRRTGVRGVSLMAENAWDLKALWANWQSQQQSKEAPAFADAS
jgi:error-prone DNA polymerase